MGCEYAYTTLHGYWILTGIRDGFLELTTRHGYWIMTGK